MRGGIVHSDATPLWPLPVSRASSNPAEIFRGNTLSLEEPWDCGVFWIREEISFQGRGFPGRIFSTSSPQKVGSARCTPGILVASKMSCQSLFMIVIDIFDLRLRFFCLVFQMRDKVYSLAISPTRQSERAVQLFVRKGWHHPEKPR